VNARTLTDRQRERTMPNLQPSSGPKRTAPTEGPVTRVVVVRETGGVRSVRSSDEPSRFGVRTGFWTAVGIGTVGFLWLTGHVGETLGFGRAIGADGLLLSNDAGLATGIRMVLGVPMRIFEMGLVDPLRMLAGFAALAVPAAGLAVAKPRVPGGPPLSKLAQGFSMIGLVAAAFVFALLIGWCALPGRHAILGAAPLDRDLFSVWLDGASAIAGFDAIALVAGILWLILLFRMPLPRGAVAGGAVAGFIALFATWASFAVSNGVLDGCHRERPVLLTLVHTDASTTSPSLVLGTMHGRTCVLGSSDRPRPMAISAPDFAITERSSLAAWMRPQPAR
jgi:hypothetical protein